jgi:COP9 signalosome complex subunit 6
MKDSTEDDANSAAAIAASTNYRFRELPYSVETGEAEMISMDFVARGGANATTTGKPEQQAAVGGDEAGGSRKKPVASLVKGDVKGKRRAVAKEDSDDGEAAVLSREEEELVAALTTKANAIKMLHVRIQLIIKYLEGLPPSYLTPNGAGGDAPPDAASTTAESVPAKTTTAEGAAAATLVGLSGGSASTAPPPSQTLLRSIQALVNRLPLLIPSTTEAFEREMLSEANDVNLVSLLNDVMQNVNELRDLGKKFHVVEQSRNRRQLGDHSSIMGGMMSGMMGMMDPGQRGFSHNAGDLM